MALNAGFNRLTSNTDTFSDWLNKTNEMIDLIREDVVTANSTTANTTGDARIIGSVSTNTLFTEVISGGDIAGVNDLYIVSNTVFANTSIDVDHDVTIGNTLNYIIKSNNLNNLIAANTTVYSIGNTTNRWDSFFRTVNVSNTVTSNNLNVTSTISTNNVNIANNLVSTGVVSLQNTVTISSNLTVDTDTLFVNSTNDRVGVGTLAPTTKLQVNGVITTNGLTSSGALSVTNTATISGNLIIDTDTLFVNSVNDRVGIGTTTPVTKLQVNGVITSVGLDSTGAVNIANNLVVNGNTVANGIVSITGNTNIQQDLTVGGDLTVNGQFELTSGDISVNNLTVLGTANIQFLDVSGLSANGVALVGTSAAVATNVITAVDSFNKTISRGLKYIIQGNNDDVTSAYTVEIMCAHNNTTSFYTRFAEIKNNFDVTIDSVIVGNDVVLRVTCPSASVSNTHYFNIIRLETR